MRSILFVLTLSGLNCLAGDPERLPTIPLPVGHSIAGDKEQIKVEIRWIFAPADSMTAYERSLVSRTPPMEGRPGLTTDPQDSLGSDGGIRLVSSTTMVRRQQPLFIDRFDRKKMDSVMRQVQQDVRTNVSFAPKITLFNGQIAELRDVTTRPFVVGLTPIGNALQPQIQPLNDGMQMVLRATARASKGIRLDARMLRSKISGVETQAAGPENTIVQVPQVTEFDTEFSIELQQGESVAVWGIPLEPVNASEEASRKISLLSRRDSVKSEQKQMILILVTPEVLEPEHVAD